MIKLTMLHYHNEGKWDTEFARKGSRGHPGNSWGREGEYNKDIYEIIKEQIKCCGFFFEDFMVSEKTRIDFAKWLTDSLSPYQPSWKVESSFSQARFLPFRAHRE